MSTTKDRIARIARLDRRRLKGLEAENTLRQLEPRLRARQERYLRELVVNTKREGAVDSATVWKLVALGDIIQDLDSEVAKGRTAEKNLAEMNEQAQAGGGE